MTIIKYYEQEFDLEKNGIAVKAGFEEEASFMRAKEKIIFDASDQLKLNELRGYLSLEEQKNYVLSINDGVFARQPGMPPLDWQIEYEFVLTCEDPPRILAASPQEHLKHSFFVAGQEVLASGSLIFEDDLSLVEITNNSGHYKLEDHEMLPAIKALYIASQKSLQRYTSYCSKPHKTYDISYAVEYNEFRLLNDENTHSTKQSEEMLDGYSDDEKLQIPTQDNSKFNKTLSSKHKIFYQKFLPRTQESDVEDSINHNVSC